MSLRVVLDLMGADNEPAELMKGAMIAISENPDIHVTLVGPESEITKALSEYQYNKEQIDVVNATEAISCHDAPVAAVRKKKDSSLVIGLQMVKDGKADAIISAGSSGAILAGGLFVVGRIKGVERAPLACIMPTSNKPIMLVDCGANVDAKPSQLLQFAQMGSIYMQHVMKVDSPKVALLNIGVEEEKGNSLTKDTYPLLKECKDINFVGNIESREICAGEVDIVVCDAFTGNAVLKMYEGVGKMLIKELKKGMMSSFKSKMGALLIKDSLKGLLKKFDATEHGGAPLLGLNGLVVKCHGNASHKEIHNAIMQCVSFKEQDISGKIEAFLSIEDAK